MKYGSFFTIIFIVTLATNVNANTIQPLSDIKQVAEQYAWSQAALSAEQEQINIQAGELDSRLRLAMCGSGLEAFTPPGSRMIGNTTVGIRCAAPKSWSIYIPVRISIYQPAVVLQRSVRRGEIISASDVLLKKVDISLLRGQPIIATEDVIGSKAKNSLNAGIILNGNSICAVCKGDSVSITVDKPSIAIMMSGIALSDGAVGESIKVQNSASKRIIDAVIVSDDTVMVSI